MFGYFTESVVADIRRRRGVDVDTEFVVHPNPNSPANSEAATLFRDSVREYNKRVQLVVENSWME